MALYFPIIDSSSIHKDFLMIRNFLTQRQCEDLYVSACLAQGVPQKVWDRQENSRVLKKNIRQVSGITFSPKQKMWVSQRLRNITPTLSMWFAQSLADFQGPYLLRYVQGEFYAPHADYTAHGALDMGLRKVSAVLFVNSHSAGGALRLYLADRKNILPEQGMFVAFNSDLLHEVLPVEQGVRCSIVTWYI